MNAGHRISPSRLLLGLAFVAALLAAVAVPASAQLAGSDTSPGDSCAGFPAGATRMTADADQDGAAVILICDGTSWAVPGGGANALDDLSDAVTNYSSANIFIGQGAGSATVDGDDNLVLGGYAGGSLTTGYNNVFLGNVAGRDTDTGWGNTFLGFQAGLQNTSGRENTFVGFYAGGDNTTGIDNIFLGGGAGLNVTTGSLNILIGQNAQTPAASTNNYLNIGDVLFASGLYGTPQVGVGNSDPQAMLHVGSGGDVTGTPLFVLSENGSGQPSLNFVDYGNDITAMGITASDYFAVATEDTQAGIQFRVGGDWTTDMLNTAVPAVTILTNGNVGIGTDAPFGKLDVADTNDSTYVRVINTDSSAARYPGVVALNYMGSAASGNPVVSLMNTRGSIGSPAAVQAWDTLGAIHAFGATTSSNWGIGAFISFTATQNYSASGHGGAIDLFTVPNNDTNAALRMRISQNGNVGIGTDSPGAALHIDDHSNAGPATPAVVVQANNPVLSLYDDVTDSLSHTHAYVEFKGVRRQIFRDFGGHDALEGLARLG